MKKYYVTTPLYYVNSEPHLGTTYSTIMVDGINRYRKLLGFNTRFLTGTDEHGQKIQQTAKERGIEPQQHCDELSRKFQTFWSTVDVEFDIFYRTTSPKHKDTVSKALDFLHQKGDIYSKEYSGWYCVSEECFYPETDIKDGKTPTGRPVEWISEKNYFFKMSSYQQKLIDHINNNPGFIAPKSRKNEVLGFLKQPLEDLSISRPKSRIHWGIPLPFDSEHVAYVWVDALINYAAACGLFQEDRKNEFNSWWNESFVQHFIGKDILTTHAVYWTTLLMAMDVKLPDQIFAHGWILNKESEKMSKSLGDVIAPEDIINVIGLDSLRYYFFSEVNFGKDAPFSVELAALKSNSDLANNLGNLLSRCFTLINKYYDGLVPEMPDQTPQVILDHVEDLYENIEKAILKNQPSDAIKPVIDMLNTTGKYLEENAPWKQAKKGELKEAGECLRVALEVARLSTLALMPVMPNKTTEILNLLNIKPSLENGAEELKKWPGVQTGLKLEKIKPIFPRIDLES